MFQIHWIIHRTKCNEELTIRQHFILNVVIADNENMYRLRRYFFLHIIAYVLCNAKMHIRQCFGSGSGRIRIIWPNPDPNPLLETWILIQVEKNDKKKIRIFLFLNHFSVKYTWIPNKLINDKKKTYPEPDPLFPEVDPRIRIHIKMKWTRNTDNAYVISGFKT